MQKKDNEIAHAVSAQINECTATAAYSLRCIEQKIRRKIGLKLAEKSSVNTESIHDVWAIEMNVIGHELYNSL